MDEFPLNVIASVTAMLSYESCLSLAQVNRRMRGKVFRVMGDDFKAWYLLHGGHSVKYEVAVLSTPGNSCGKTEMTQRIASCFARSNSLGSTSSCAHLNGKGEIVTLRTYHARERGTKRVCLVWHDCSGVSEPTKTPLRRCRGVLLMVDPRNFEADGLYFQDEGSKWLRSLQYYSAFSRCPSEVFVVENHRSDDDIPSHPCRKQAMVCTCNWDRAAPPDYDVMYVNALSGCGVVEVVQNLMERMMHSDSALPLDDKTKVQAGLKWMQWRTSFSRWNRPK